LNKRTIVAAVSAALAVAAGVASARNMHCAGGVQYYYQAMNDKGKGNTEDYQREIAKAVNQLQMCAAEDSLDFEAMGLLGKAYAEVDSAADAGIAFASALRGLEAKGDKKKLDIVRLDRLAAWVRWNNDGITRIQSAQQATEDLPLKAGAELNDDQKRAVQLLDEAEPQLRRATAVLPDSVTSMRMLGYVFYLRGDFMGADDVLRQGLRRDPSNKPLLDMQRVVRRQHAQQLLDAKKYDEAIAYYGELLKESPDDGGLHTNVGEAYMQKAQVPGNAGKSADWKASGMAYAKASDLKPEDADMAFMAAQSLRNGGELGKAEKYWRLALKNKPDDQDALLNLARNLNDMQQGGEAVNVLLANIHEASPKTKDLFRELGLVYGKLNNAGKSSEMLILSIAIDRGTASADAAGAAKAAKAGSGAANTLAGMGAPDAVYDWSAESRKHQTWVYQGKKQAFTFDVGAGMTLVQKTDWSSSGLTKK
jgi:tetratricopeptide (TPR) repeat protein